MDKYLEFEANVDYMLEEGNRLVNQGKPLELPEYLMAVAVLADDAKTGPEYVDFFQINRLGLEVVLAKLKGDHNLNGNGQLFDTAFQKIRGVQQIREVK